MTSCILLTRFGLVTLCLVLPVLTQGTVFTSCALSAEPTVATGNRAGKNQAAEEWQGWEKKSFSVDQRDAFVIVPKVVAKGNPWIWRTEFFGHEPQADLALLEHGFHVAYINMQNLYGGPEAMIAMDAMYDHVTREFELSSKTVLEGFSRGGLFSLNWAARRPERIACLYNDAPVCDFRSWPGGKGQGKGSESDWERCKSVYGLTEEQALEYALNPVDNLKPMADAKIPILHVCGAVDDVVPVAENSLIIQKRYTELGGSFTLINKPHCNHHPHSLRDPALIVNFILTHTGFSDRVTPVATPFGYDYFELRSGLSNCRTKFENEKTGRVVFLGGSITASSGWRDSVCADLLKRFPETKFDFINAGIPSLGSTPGAFRFQRDVLKNGPVDLLFVEAAVNDDTNGFSDVEQVRGMEGIVRQGLLSNPNMNLVLLHFADPGKLAEIRSGKTPGVIANHECVASNYKVPSINLAREVTERIEAGEFTWEADFRDLHPAPFGHDLYASSIGRLFDAAWKPEAASHSATLAKLPAPIDSASYFQGRLVSPADIVNSENANPGNGWLLVPDWKPSDTAGTRAGFVNVPALVAEASGATLNMTFTGRGIGLFVASGPDTGTLEFRIDDGDWQSMDLFTQWSPSLHLPWAKMLASDLSDGEHRMELRVATQSNAASKGQAVRIIHFLVNGPASSASADSAR